MNRHHAEGWIISGRKILLWLAGSGLVLALVACSATRTLPPSTGASQSLSAAPSAVASASAEASAFLPTGSMTVGRHGHTATLLADGRVLIAGGWTKDTQGLSSAELYDPTARSFSPAGSMTVPRLWHTATLLSDGRVLIAGGYDADDFNGTGVAVPSTAPETPGAPDPRRVAELYDPKTGTFAPTGSMTTDRYLFTATRLHDGRVLIVGGQSLRSGASVGAELYDPKSGIFKATGPMASSHSGHTATLLHDGTVLIAGGDAAEGSSASAEIYDPATGKFRPGPSMVAFRVGHSATLLYDQRVLIAGGVATDRQQDNAVSAEIYDPVTRLFSPTGPMTMTRTGHTATLLLDGRVLLAGGDTLAGAPGLSAELYDPRTGIFSATDPMRAPHVTATRLSDGSVLMTGGSVSVVGGAESLASAEVFRPH